jgi:hypothetical protein
LKYNEGRSQYLPVRNVFWIRNRYVTELLRRTTVYQVNTAGTPTGTRYAIEEMTELRLMVINKAGGVE